MGDALPSNSVIDSALRRLFISYASFGDASNSAALTAAKFSKIWRDAGLIGSGFTSVDVDLVFVRTAQLESKAAAKSKGFQAKVGLKKHIDYAQFLEATYTLAAKMSGDARPAPPATGGRGLLLLLLESLLPLVERAAGASTDSETPVGEEELLSRAAVLEVLFAHYAAPVRVASANDAAGSPTFWDEIKMERTALGAPDAADENDPWASGRAVSAPGIDLGSWQRLMAHFGVCPTLGSKAEIGRLFQQEALRAPPTGALTFPQVRSAARHTHASPHFFSRRQPLRARARRPAGALTRAVIRTFTRLVCCMPRSLSTRSAASPSPPSRRVSTAAIGTTAGAACRLSSPR